MTFLDRVVKMLLPREQHFFELLEKGAACATLASAQLVSLCNANERRDERDQALERLRDVEHQADGVIHEVYDALNRTFVTPIDRSDIYALATHLEEIVDLMHATAMQVQVHAIERLPAGSVELAKLIDSSTAEIQQAVGLLRTMKRLPEIRAYTTLLPLLSPSFSSIYRSPFGSLFPPDPHPFPLIQHKEFL